MHQVRLRGENEELRQELETQAQELERKYIEQNARLKHEYEQRLDELKKVRMRVLELCKAGRKDFLRALRMTCLCV